MLFLIVVMVVLICGVYWVWNQNEKSAIKLKASTIILGDTDSNIDIPLDSQIQYSHSIYSSVGYNYEIEYDKAAFVLTYKTIYDDPDAVSKGMCGGDSAILTTTLIPQKKGTHIVKVIHTFRGNVNSVITYCINVK